MCGENSRNTFETTLFRVKPNHKFRKFSPISSPINPIIILLLFL